MPAKHKRFIVYPDDLAAAQLETIRAYYEEKNRNAPFEVTDGYIGRDMIKGKYYEIVNETTRGLTMQKVYDEVLALRDEVAQLRTTMEAERHANDYDHA